MDCSHARLQNICGTSMENGTRYSPAKCIGADMKVVSGNPDLNTSAPALWNARTSRCRQTETSGGTVNKSIHISIVTDSRRYHGSL